MQPALMGAVGRVYATRKVRRGHLLFLCRRSR